jgi:hypothetical protein
MLEQAGPYTQEINKIFQKISIDPKYKYYNIGYASLDVSPDKDTWSYHEFVSIDKFGDVKGFMRLSINRMSHIVYELSVFSVEDEKFTNIFSKDIKELFMKIFCQYKYNKVKFKCVVGSPHEKTYDSFIKRYGGEIVGIFKKDVALEDNTIHDMKHYEIHRDQFLLKSKSRIERAIRKNPEFKKYEK